MPLTFFDIERRKSWRIGILFVFLVSLYFIINLVIYLAFYSYISFRFLDFSKGLIPGTSHLLVIFLFSLIIAVIHFYASTFSAVQHVKKNLGAMEPDPDDGIHKSMMNILDEIHIVSGKKMKITGLVIPTLSLNALSMVDPKGNAVIAITEGLLSRISRSQLEAVMAHEAYHIFSGDCLETTVASALFGIPSSFIEKTKELITGTPRVSLRFAIPGFILITVIWFLVKLSQLLNLFISREREYRADAGAIRMTRNPLALAEVLYFLSRNRGGFRFIGQGLENLCIVGPTARRLDEAEGWFSDLMSTHPPIRKRIRVMLNMARASITQVAQKVEKKERKKDQEIRSDQEGLFYAIDGKYMWQGPFTLFELAALPWLSTLTWVSEQGGDVKQASDIPVINTFFSERVNKEEDNVSGLVCHTCHTPLVKRSYERTSVLQCRFCGGVLVDDRKIPRIIARKDVKHSKRIEALAKVILMENQKKRYSPKKIDINNRVVPLLNCPGCGQKMRRVYYTYTYLVEVDRCSSCGVTWFDHDELEILQCMIDNKMVQSSFK